MNLDPNDRFSEIYSSARLDRPNTAEVVIVGGGVIGAVTAYYLTLRGICPLVIEAERLAHGASGYAAGILTPYTGSSKPDLLALSSHTLGLHSTLAEALTEETGIDYGYELRPHLRCVFTESGASELARWQADRNSEGLETEWLSPSAARGLTPWLTGDIIGSLISELEPTVDSRLFTLTAVKAALARGAELFVGKAVGLRSTGRSYSDISTGPVDQQTHRSVTGVELEDGTVISTPKVVLAMGPWTTQASTWLDFSIPVEPQKGEMLYLSSPSSDQGPPLDMMLSAFDLGGAIVPKKLSDTVVGATRDDSGFDRSVTKKGRREIIEKTRRLSDRINTARFSGATACLRPKPADGIPYVGAVPGWSGAYLASGHWSEGVHFAPLTGHVLSEMIAGVPITCDVSALSPERVLKESSSPR